MSYRHLDYLPEFARVDPQPAPPPHAHARKKPNITLEQLEALNLASLHRMGISLAPSGINRALLNRKLVSAEGIPNIGTIYTITESGRLLIRLEYAALKEILTGRQV